MLESISLDRFAITESVNVDFDAGMTAITGETGAGKSIMVDALSLIAGKKADDSWIHPDSDKCTISAAFNIRDLSSARHWLDQNGIEDEDGQVYLSRVLSRGGRSKSFLNGQMTTLGKLRELSSLLMTICSQHEHIELLAAERQRSVFDACLPDSALIDQVKTDYANMVQAQKAHEALVKEVERQKEKRDLIAYQLEELNKIEPAEGEFESLEVEQKQLAHSEQALHKYDYAVKALYYDDQSLISQLRDIQTGISKLPDNEVNTSIVSALESACIEIEELNGTINGAFSGIDTSQERKEEVEQRLSLLFWGGRKYSVAPADLWAFHRDLMAQYETMSSADDELPALSEKRHEAESVFRESAQKLDDLRRNSAHAVEKKVSQFLKSLAMPEAQFVIEVKEAVPSEHGINDVVFHFSANPEIDPMPLSRVASGGELSRVSLALQVVCSEYASMPVMIFDEVDVGIGGNTAATVGKLMRTMADGNQLVVITHQAPVAKSSHHHIKIEKEHVDGKTQTEAIKLSSSQVEQEIQRMVGI